MTSPNPRSGQPAPENGDPAVLPQGHPGSPDDAPEDPRTGGTAPSPGATDTPPAPAVSTSTLLASAVATLAGMVGTAVGSAAKPRPLIILTVVAGAGWFIWQEWTRVPVLDVGRVWNENIEGLGIRPLFPPQEDFHVGDVYAVLRLRNSEDEGRLTAGQKTLNNKALNIGHVELTAQLREAAQMRPRYLASLTVPSEAAVTGAASPSEERPIVVRGRGGEDVPLSSMMFPGITMTVDRGISLPGIIAQIFGRVSSSRSDTIVIDRPKTYGIRAQDAIGHLGLFCKSEAGTTRNVCAGGHLRALLAVQYGPQACGRWSNGDYIFDVSLLMVTRVYASRLITADIDRRRDMSVQASASNPRPPSPANPPGAAAAEQGRTERTVVPDDGASAADGLRLRQNGPPGALMAFGYQAVSITPYDEDAEGGMACP